MAGVPYNEVIALFNSSKRHLAFINLNIGRWRSAPTLGLVARKVYSFWDAVFPFSIRVDRDAFLDVRNRATTVIGIINQWLDHLIGLDEAFFWDALVPLSLKIDMNKFLIVFQRVNAIATVRTMDSLMNRARLMIKIIQQWLDHLTGLSRNFTQIDYFLFYSLSDNIRIAASNTIDYDCEEFIKKFPKQRISDLIGEIEIFYKFSQHLPTHLTDDNWQKLMEATSLEEKEEFLFHLSNNEVVIKQGEQKMTEIRNNYYENLKVRNQLFENGSMVYGSEFYRLFGDEYFHARKFIDRVSLIYGSRCCQNASLNEFIPKIIIDCRKVYQLHVKFLNTAISRIQQVHDYNMLSDYPMPISIATSNDKENIYKYEPHPFIPEITTKNILDVCKRDGIKKEEIAYISSSATQYLPDDPQIIKERFKAFVLSPLEDRQNPRQRPNFYAPQDQIQVYRLPLEKYLGFRPPTFMPPSTFIELLRVIISGRSSSWDWAIDNRVPNLRIQSKKH
uniref:SAM-dependent MTase TRM10-type domain-containing protein n=1 Tax=Meloidogyne javanica TaxID=6303 RepID=A0A915LJ47_MELJA